jgi:ADP-ribosylation factor-like protein 6
MRAPPSTHSKQITVIPLVLALISGSMGLFKRLASALGISKRSMRIVVVGLDNAGKSTIIERIKPAKAQMTEVVPTVGFKVEEFSKNNLNFTVFDMSGQSKYRELWGHYYKEVEAIIFVIDSTDKVRMAVVKEEIEVMLHHPDVQGSPAPLLFYANKMDAAEALSVHECMSILGLEDMTKHSWQIV